MCVCTELGAALGKIKMRKIIYLLMWLSLIGCDSDQTPVNKVDPVASDLT